MSLMIPWFGLLCHISSLIVLRAFRPSPYPKGQWCSPHLPAQPQLAGGRCEYLCHFSVSACSCGKCIFCFIFSLSFQLCCPLRFQNSPQTRLWEGSLLYGSFSSFMTPSPRRASIPKSFVSVLVFNTFSYHLSKRSGYLSRCLVSSASVQKLFCESCSTFSWSFDEFVGEKVISLSYSSTILEPPSNVIDF